MKSITLEGKEYPVLLNLNALAECEDATGKKSSEIFAALTEDNLSIKVVRALMFVSVQEGCQASNTPFDMDEKQFGRLISIGKMTELMEALDLSQLSGSEEPEETENAKKKKTGVQKK